MPGTAQGYIQDLRRKLRQKSLDRLRAKIAEILRLNTPLADIIRDHALPCLLVASLLRFRSVSVSWDHIIFVDRLCAKIAKILRLINTPLTDIIRDHALPRLPVASSAFAPSPSPRTTSSLPPYLPSASPAATAPSLMSFPPSPPLARYSNPSTRSPTPSSTPPSPSSPAHDHRPILIQWPLLLRPSPPPLLFRLQPRPLWAGTAQALVGRARLARVPCRAWHARAMPVQARVVPCRAWSMGWTFQARHDPF